MSMNAQTTGDPPPYPWWHYAWPPQQTYWPIAESPRTLPVNLPFPSFGGVTVAVLDGEGNLTIKVDQPRSGEWRAVDEST